ncbi:D-methionine transport system permease protein MetI [Arsenophonus endosymbiont of Bemisia tabaci Q2]|nr:D-methionine transport system permease protein MetI [Arsenophonus endosymbiont of Bemisia tabaci Q2]
MSEKMIILLLNGTLDRLIMTFVSGFLGFLGFLLGLPIGIL